MQNGPWKHVLFAVSQKTHFRVDNKNKTVFEEVSMAAYFYFASNVGQIGNPKFFLRQLYIHMHTYIFNLILGG